MIIMMNWIIAFNLAKKNSPVFQFFIPFFSITGENKNQKTYIACISESQCSWYAGVGAQ